MKEQMEGIFLTENNELISEDQQIEVMKENFPQFLELLDTKIIPELSDLLNLMSKALPCEQLQVMCMDAESLHMNLKDLVTKGARAPFKDIPLSESVIEEPIMPFGTAGEPAGQPPGPIISEHVDI